MFFTRFAVVAVIVLTGGALTAEAGNYSSRSYGSGAYSYRKYTYYSQSYRSYRMHYAVYSSYRPRYVYYYNPHTQRYWGRYDLASGTYSLLAAGDRKPRLEEIPDSAFPAGGRMPPEEAGGETLALPPEFQEQGNVPRTTGPVPPVTLPGGSPPRKCP